MTYAIKRYQEIAAVMRADSQERLPSCSALCDRCRQDLQYLCRGINSYQSINQVLMKDDNSKFTYSINVNNSIEYFCESVPM